MELEPGYLKIYQGTVLDDLVWFYNDNNLDGFAKLYSNDLARSKEATIPANAKVVTIQSIGCPTIYQAGTATYRIFGDPDYEPVPVPCSLLLVGTGLGVIGLRRFKRGWGKADHASNGE